MSNMWVSEGVEYFVFLRVTARIQDYCILCFSGYMPSNYMWMKIDSSIRMILMIPLLYPFYGFFERNFYKL